jgi:hypothetical protein
MPNEPHRASLFQVPRSNLKEVRCMLVQVQTNLSIPKCAYIENVFKECIFI